MTGSKYAQLAVAQPESRIDGILIDGLCGALRNSLQRLVLYLNRCGAGRTGRVQGQHAQQRGAFDRPCLVDGAQSNGRAVGEDSHQALVCIGNLVGGDGWSENARWQLDALAALYEPAVEVGASLRLLDPLPPFPRPER